MSIEPNSAIILNNKDFTLSLLGRDEEAIAYYNRALEVNPVFYITLTNKGDVLTNLGKNKEAIEHYDKALSIAPGDDYVLESKMIAETLMNISLSS